MKLAIVGSRGIKFINLDKFVSKRCCEIVSGGANGVDTLAREYALSKGIKLTEFLPNYSRCGRAAPLLRNKEIVEYADEVLAIWDGRSRGTKHLIDYCVKIGKPVKVVFPEE